MTAIEREYLAVVAYYSIPGRGITEIGAQVRHGPFDMRCDLLLGLKAVSGPLLTSWGS